MSDFSKVKGVLFDLNGIITDSWAYHSKSWQEIAASWELRGHRNWKKGLRGGTGLIL